MVKTLFFLELLSDRLSFRILAAPLEDELRREQDSEQSEWKDLQRLNKE